MDTISFIIVVAHYIGFRNIQVLGIPVNNHLRQATYEVIIIINNNVEIKFNY